MITEFPEECYALIETDERFREDITVWWKWRNKNDVPLREAFDKLVRIPAFMSVAYYRFNQAGIPRSSMPRRAAATDLYITTPDLGGGFRAHHAHSTWVNAEKVGRGCIVYQNVTIGEGRSGRPVIGDRVKICTGAVIYGGVHIGDDVKIAPNAVVTFDVPAGKKVFPARSVIV